MLSQNIIGDDHSTQSKLLLEKAENCFFLFKIIVCRGNNQYKMPKQHLSMLTNKHGLTRFIHVPSEGKHMLSVMLIIIIPSMPGGYMKILLPTSSAKLKIVVEQPRHRVKGFIIVIGYKVLGIE